MPPHQSVPQIRQQQVNISQQQRVPSAMVAGNVRMSPQQLQMLHAQVQQQAQQQQQQRQHPPPHVVAANANLAAGAPSVTQTHLSPSYASRAATSSPAVSQSSPPRNSSTPNPPRPPSAQPHTGMLQASPNMQSRPASNMAAHYMPIAHHSHPTPEMIEQMRLQNMAVSLSDSSMDVGSYIDGLLSL